MIKIDGVEIPTPSDLIVGEQDIVKAERNARGDLIGEFIAKKVKLELSWKYVNPEQIQLILNAIQPFLFTVEYPDPGSGEMKTLTFYKGDRKVSMLDYRGGVARWRDFGFNVIQR